AVLADARAAEEGDRGRPNLCDLLEADPELVGDLRDRGFDRGRAVVEDRRVARHTRLRGTCDTIMPRRSSAAVPKSSAYAIVALPRPPPRRSHRAERQIAPPSRIQTGIRLIRLRRNPRCASASSRSDPRAFPAT